MRIFILGGGYVGSALITQWSNPADNFWVSTTTKEKLISLSRLTERAILWEGNDEALLTSIVDACDGMVVCVAPGSNQSYEATYFRTAQTVKNAIAKRKRPFYLLYTSSTSVYGDHGGQIVDEMSSLFASTENGRILCAAEDIYLSCQNELVDVCVLRLAGICGPGRELEKRAATMSGKTIPGNGDSPTNHIHRDDIVRAVEFCFNRKLTGIFNLANNDHRSRKQLYDDICHKLSVPCPEWDASTPSLHSSNCIVSNKKICDLGFKISNE